MLEELDPSVLDEMIAGDVDAFQQILKRHIGPITGYVMRMTTYSQAFAGTAESSITNSTASNIEDVIEEIVQETFVRLWEKRQSYDPKRAQLSTWLHRIAHNLCIDHFRRVQRSPASLDDKNQAEAETQTQDNDRPDQQTAEQRRAVLLRECLRALPEAQRNALVMCHYQGLSNKDTAEIMALSVSAVESLLARARKKLKQELLHLQPDCF